MKKLMRPILTLGVLSAVTWGLAQESTGDFNTLFTEIDTDDNGVLSQEELRTHVFGIFNTNGDEVISDEEYSSAVERIYPNGFETTLADLDSDANGELSQDEFSSLYDTNLFSTFDTDGNGEVGVAEFTQVMEGQTVATTTTTTDLYSTFDADSNAVISENEFSDGIFGLFDGDGDSLISEEEYNTGVEQFYGGDFSTAFNDFDSDADGSIGSEEFTTAYPNDLYSTFDSDGNSELSESEFSTGLFGIADANDDGILGEDEFNTSSSWWGSAGFADFDADNSGDISETEFNETFVGLGGITGVVTAVYVPYGVVEVGDYELVDLDTGGNLILRTVSPSDQGVDVVLIGPYGYKSVNEVVDEEIIENIPAGTYIVAATDDNLEMVSTKVDVRVGQVVPVTLTLNAIDTTDYNPGYEPFNFFDFTYEPVDSPDLGELNVLFNYEQDFQPAGLVGSIIGPDDYRQDLDGETDTVELDGLVPGNYLIAVTTQGGDLAEGIVEVRAGEAANVTMTLSGITSTQ